MSSPSIRGGSHNRGWSTLHSRTPHDQMFCTSRRRARHGWACRGEIDRPATAPRMNRSAVGRDFLTPHGRLALGSLQVGMSKNESPLARRLAAERAGANHSAGSRSNFDSLRRGAWASRASRLNLLFLLIFRWGLDARTRTPPQARPQSRTPDAPKFSSDAGPNWQPEKSPFDIVEPPWFCT
jgi:hypothetical protein